MTRCHCNREANRKGLAVRCAGCDQPTRVCPCPRIEAGPAWLRRLPARDTTYLVRAA